MNCKKILSSTKGLTLIEVLASLTILSIVLIGIMSFFTQAFSYTNKNETKTAAVNVARNALMYVENQSFIEMREKFSSSNSTNQNEELRIYICKNPNGSEQYNLFWKGETQSADCSSITVNNIKYDVRITSNYSSDYKENHEDYFVPLKAVVTWNDGDHQKSTEVEGAIQSEDIR
ncbi:type IV pilus modification PilV family protein [Cytobacillus gottheilii]|uniref:type IV pilus modification PilV family protein n=1 Tax=Cytobacillus gottheilii TaxID=859144 RepID=UPI00082D01A2|nr:type II secretion system protein [Cytobacillus gottheilii]